MSDQGLINTLNALLQPRQRKELKALEPRGGLPGKRGSAVYKAPPSSGGGMSSPLTETGIREYYPVTLITSSDGIFTLQVEHLNKQFLTDADGVEHEFNYMDPEA